MMTVSLVSFLVGAALAKRYKVMVLIPMTVIALSSSLAIGVTHALTVWSVAIMATSAAICLQTGYFLGMGFHHVLGARRSSSLTSPTTSTSHVTH